MCSDFLPPWLRDDDSDDEQKGARQQPAQPTPPPSDDNGALPPWLVGDSERTTTFTKETGELSDEFLAGADELPDSAPSHLTYDQYVSIQNEKKRPRSLDEEVPDLLGTDDVDLELPPGVTKLPDTGELPDWFLGLEELGDEDAPDWFVNPQTTLEPEANLPTESQEQFAVPHTPPSPIPRSDEELDMFFREIGEQRTTQPPIISPDMFAAVMQPDLNVDTGPLPAFTEGDENDEAFQFASPVDSETKPLADDAADTSPPAFEGFEDFFSEQPSVVQSIQDEPFQAPPDTLAFDFDLLTADLNSQEPDSEQNADSAAPGVTAFAEPDIAIPPPPDTSSTNRGLFGRLGFKKRDRQPEAPPPPPPAPEPPKPAALDEDSLSWLNEISSIVDAVVEHGIDTGDADSEPIQPPATTDLLHDQRSANRKVSALASETPDWLSQIQEMPDQLDEELNVKKTTGSTGQIQAEKPVIDFSGLDFASFSTAEPGVDTDTSLEDPFQNLFSDIGIKPTHSPEEEPPVSPPASNYHTVILTDDAPYGADFETEEAFSKQEPTPPPAPVQATEPQARQQQPPAKPSAPPPVPPKPAAPPPAVPPSPVRQQQPPAKPSAPPPAPPKPAAPPPAVPPSPARQQPPAASASTPDFSADILPFDNTPLKTHRPSDSMAKPLAPPAPAPPIIDDFFKLEELRSEQKPDDPAKRKAGQDEDLSWLNNVSFDEQRAQPNLAKAAKPDSAPAEPLEDFYRDMWSSTTEQNAASAVEQKTDPPPQPDQGVEPTAERVRDTTEQALAALFGDLSGTQIEDSQPPAQSAPEPPTPDSAPTPVDSEPEPTVENFYLPPNFGPHTAQLIDILGDLGQPNQASIDADFNALFGNLPPAQAEPKPRVAADTHDLDSLFSAYTSAEADQASDNPRDGFAANTDELNSLFVGLGGDSEEDDFDQYPVPNTNELSSLFDNFETDATPLDNIARGSESRIDANVNELNGLFDNFEADAAPLDIDTLFSESRIAANTNELNSLFDNLEADATPLDTDSPISESRIAANTSELNSLFDAYSVEAGGDFTMDAAQERYMPANDDFDALFADFDNESANTNSSWAEDNSADKRRSDDEIVQPNEDDLEALFAAYESEQQTAQTETSDDSLDFPSDDDFYRSLGLDDPSPPPRDSSPPKKPDDDFFEGFSEPETTNTTYVSGEQTPSMWEDEPAVTAGNALPHVPAFDFDANAESMESPRIDTDALADWAEVDPASRSFNQPPAAFEEPKQSIPKTGPLPKWLDEIGDISNLNLEQPAQGLPTSSAPMDWAETGDLADYLKELDSPDKILSGSLAAATPITSTAEIDIEQLLTDSLPDLSIPEPPPEALAPSELLSEIQSSVGVVSAAAVARQLQDKPEDQLSARLQKLRIRATDEVQAAPEPKDDDTIAQVLPGLREVLTPAAVIVEPSDLVSGAVLSDIQQRHVALVRELVGVTEDVPKRNQRFSAIDLTYQAPHLRDEQDVVESKQPSEETSDKAVSHPKTKLKRTRTYRIDRLLIGLLLVLGVGLPFFVDGLQFGNLPPALFAADSSQAGAFDTIDKIDESDYVLVGLDYSPSAAAELDAMTNALVRHILLRGGRPIFISVSPFGILRAQIFMDAINQDDAFLELIGFQAPRQLEPNTDYFVARFLPGSAIGLRAFSEETAAMLQVDINGQTTGLNLESLSNISLIVVIADRVEDVRGYAEQIAPLARSPLVAAVNYASAALVRPYADGQASVFDLLVGFSDAMTYTQMLTQVEPVERTRRPLVAPEASSETETQPPASEAPPSGETTPAGDATAQPESTSPASPNSETIIGTAIVISADGANLRSGPGTDFARLGGIRRNTVVSVLAFSDDGEWVNVRTEEGLEGWVSSGLLALEAPTPSASSDTGPSLYRPSSQMISGPSDERLNTRWYAMNWGILLSIIIITLGGILGILRGLFRRRLRS